MFEPFEFSGGLELGVWSLRTEPVMRGGWGLELVLFYRQEDQAMLLTTRLD